MYLSKPKIAKKKQWLGADNLPWAALSPIHVHLFNSIS